MAAAVKVNDHAFTGDVEVWKWTLTDADPTGAHVPIPRHMDKTIHVTGNFGTGGSVAAQGSNELPAPADGDFISMRDPAAVVIAITNAASNMRAILEAPYWFRPKLTAGTGVTVVVYLKANRTK